MQSKVETILILAKTYPSPSAKHIETSCVAGIGITGKMLRLYPIPFRLLGADQQFKKWQWIEVRIEKAANDHRPESHKVYIDTLRCLQDIKTNGEWVHRWEWLDKIPQFSNPDSMNELRLKSHISLALLKPKSLERLEIVKARSEDWTDEEKAKLLQMQMQGELFTQEQVKQEIKDLKKIPYDFYYHYIYESPDGEKQGHFKIVDWEIGALYWNCVRSHKDNWEKPFRERVEREMQKKDLMFLMGNQHRFQDQWLIISLIYPPKRKVNVSLPQSLF